MHLFYHLYCIIHHLLKAEIFRRGRNAKKPTKSKNATVAEYVRSTGFEALLGYLYLTGQTERIRQLFFSEDDEI